MGWFVNIHDLVESSTVTPYSSQVQVTSSSFSNYQQPMDKVDGVFESDRAVDSVYYPSVTVSGPVGPVGPIPSGLAQLPLQSSIQHPEGYHYSEQVAFYPNSVPYVDMSGNQPPVNITYTVYPILSSSSPQNSNP